MKIGGIYWVLFGKDFDSFRFRLWLWLGVGLWKIWDLKTKVEDDEKVVEGITFTNSEDYLKMIQELE